LPMTQEPASEPPSPPKAPRRPVAVAWRLGAVALVVLAMVAAAYFLRNPAGFRGGGVGRGSDEAWPTSGDDNPGGPSEKAGGPEDPTNNLRKLMAGLVMAAAEEDGDYKDPRNATPEERRKFIAEQFGLPPDYPRSAAPADVAPKGAEVLIVLENPGGADARMVLLRVRKEIHAALADFHKLYVTSGWATEGPGESKAQPDQGWLMRFTKGDRERVVYAHPRRVDNETLVAVYDSRY